MNLMLASIWSGVWAVPWARAVACVVVLCILIAVGFYIVSRFCDYAGDDRREAHFADANLQEMLRRGDISEAEFRTIQSKSYGVSNVNSDAVSPPSPPEVENSVVASQQDEPNRRHRFLPPSDSPQES